MQEPGDRPAGLPPRCSRSNQHASGAADRGIAARSLAEVTPGHGRRESLTVNPMSPGLVTTVDEPGANVRAAVGLSTPGRVRCDVVRHARPPAPNAGVT